MDCCSRCGGKLRLDVFYGDGSDWDKFPAWHCYLCGEITDPAILLNRRASRERHGPEPSPGDRWGDAPDKPGAEESFPSHPGRAAGKNRG